MIEDDSDKNCDPIDPPCPAPIPIGPKNHFNFKNYDLSIEVREKLQCKLRGFDSDCDNEFSDCEVKNALTRLFGADRS